MTNGHKIELPHVEGFEKSGLLINDELESFLVNTFPLAYLGYIDKITYVDTYRPTTRNESLTLFITKGLYEATCHVIDEDQDKESIEVYRQGHSGNQDAQLMLEHIAYAVSQTVYDRLPPDLQQAWQQISHASKDVRSLSSNMLEDFCKSYVDYLLHPATLLNKNKDKYDFFDSNRIAPQSQLGEPLD